MAHDDNEKAQLLADIWAAAQTFIGVVDNAKSVRVTFNPAALTSAATQSGAWNMGSVYGIVTDSMNDANLSQDNLNAIQAFNHNTVRS